MKISTKHSWAGSVITIALLMVMVGSMSSCTSVGKENRRRLMQLQIGQTREQVVNIMGMPHMNEGYKTERGVSREVLYYGTGSLSPESELIPLIFENGKLIGWGQDFYQKEKP